MIHPRRIVLVWIGVASFLLATAFIYMRVRDRTDAGTAQNPIVLVLSPAYGDADTASRLGAMLRERTGLAVEVRMATSRSEAIEATSTPDVDGGLLPVFEYLLAHQEFGMEAHLQVLRDGGAHEYRGALFVRADAPIAKVEDLEGKPVGFVDPASTTGYLLAVKVLDERRVHVEPVFLGSHQAALAALRDGRVVAAATYDSAPATGLRMLASTGAAPNEPVFFHPGIPAERRERLTSSFLHLADSADGRALLSAMGGITGFAPVTDSDYRAARELLAATQKRIEDVVPSAARVTERQPMIVLAPE